MPLVFPPMDIPPMDMPLLPIDIPEGATT
jgi:hypothetical protein